MIDRRLNHAWILILCWTAVACTGLDAGHAPSLDEAETAHIQLDLDRSRQILVAVSNDQAFPVEDRATALQRLAILNWRFTHQTVEARALLERAEALGVEAFGTHMGRARLETATGNYDEARRSARMAIELAVTPTEGKEGRIAFAVAVLRKATSEPTGTHGGHVLVPDTLIEASSMMKTILDKQPGLLDPSRLQLGLALLLEDGPVALEAWRSYYRTPTREAVNGLFADAGRTLGRVLPDWKGRRLTRTEREALVLALADSRFFEYAALLAVDRRVPPAERIDGLPPIQDVVAYNRYVRTIIELADEHYRMAAIGNGRIGAFKDAFDTAARELWEALHFPADRPRYSRAEFDRELDLRFGALIRLGATSRYYNLFMGHRVVDEAHTIEQYGHHAEVRFVVLDFMISNGYQSWFWDGRQAAGGWADESTITQVRGPYADDGFEAWEKLTDPTERQKAEKELREKTAADEFIAEANPYAYLEGLGLRLVAKANHRILNSLTDRGLEDVELQLAFMRELEQRIQESSIFAHEGRHLIDRRIGGLGRLFRRGSEVEFRAKLSEVAFAPDPYLAFGAIINRSIGDGTSHGMANERIMKGIVAWIENHADAITHIDSSRPLLPQLDRLEPDQIRAIFRSMDPLAQ